MSATRDISFKQVLEFARIQKKTIVPLGDWEKNPRLQAKTLVCLQYGELPEIEPYRIQHKVSHRLNHEIPQADFFAATSGNVTDEVIIKYIEQQTQEPPDGHFKIDDDL